MKHIKIFSLSLFLLSSLLLYNCNPKDSGDSKDMAEEQNEEKFDDKKTENDAEFVVDAADGGMLEVRLAELAMKTSASNEVKNYAKMILTDHSKANTELKTIAEKKNITLPIDLSDKNQKTLDDLKDKTGEDFDKAYCKVMVDDHKEDIKEFKKQAEDGSDPELKSWASEKVVTLEQHLVAAEDMESKRN
jgi:putative membrane protein